MATQSRKENIATLKYYLRLEMYGHVVAEAPNFLSSHDSEADTEILFWAAFSNGMLGNITDLVCGLDYLHHRYRSLEYPVLVALEHFKSKNNVISSIDASRSITDKEHLLVAEFHLYTGNVIEAEKCIQRVLSFQGSLRSISYLSALSLRAWVALKHASKLVEVATFEKVFEQVKATPDRLRDFDVMMLCSNYYYAIGDCDTSLKCINEMLAVDALFVPSLIEKAKLELLSCDFEAAVQTSKNLLMSGKDNSESLWTCLVIEIVYKGNSSRARDIFQQLSTCITEKEVTNGRLRCRLSMILARIPFQDSSLIKSSKIMIRKACEIDPLSAPFHAELGFHELLTRNYAAALSAYQRAVKMEQITTKIYYGMIHCLILLDRLDEAAQQLELLSVIDDMRGTNPDFFYMQSILAFKKLNYPEHMDYLTRAATLIVSGNWHTFQGYDSLESFANLELSTRVAKQTLRYFYTSVKELDACFAPTNHKATERGLELLQFAVRHTVSYTEGCYILAKVEFQKNRLDNVLRIIDRCNPCSATFLLRAQVEAAGNHFEAADQYLKESLSCDFRIQENAVFKLLTSKVLSSRGLISESCHILENEIGGISRDENYALDDEPLVMKSDVVMIFEQYGIQMSKLNPQKAKEVLRKAQQIFSGAAEEVQILIALSKVYLEEKDIANATQTLDEVQPDSLLYDSAQIAKADIFLEHHNDESQYASIFREIALRKKTPESFESLGDAYIKVQRPNDAIAAYSDALRLQPASIVHKKIGRALISLQKFDEATQHYHNALRDMPGNSGLCCELTNLYIQRGMLDNAEETILREADVGNTNKIDMQQVQSASSLLFKLVKMYKLRGQVPKMRKMLGKLYSIHRNLLVSDILLTTESKDTVRKTVSRICLEIGQCENQLQNFSGEEEYYNRALEVNPLDEKVILAMATLHFRRRAFDKCRNLCSEFLNRQSSEEMSMLLGDIKMQESDYEGATLEYTKVLQKTPDNAFVIARFMTILRVSGKLDDVAPEIIGRAEREEINRSLTGSGLSFCKGLHLRYTGRMADAAVQFNLARLDSKWRPMAVENMLELYVCDPNEWNDRNNVIVIENLWKEMSNSNDVKNKKVKFLGCLCLMATKVDENIRQAKKELQEMLQEDNTCVLALYGISVVLHSEKDDKAHSCLKRLAKLPYNLEHWDKFEFAFLTLARHYYDNGKKPLAQDLCRRCLSHNRSCLRALLILAVMAVNEGAHIEAAEYYEQAWKFSGKSSPSLGLQLAVCYMSLGKFVEAIDIGLGFPDFPSIQESVLNVSIMSLRP